MTVTKESETMHGYCQCGKPLHYSQQSIKNMVDKIANGLDPFINITIESLGTFRVQRHFLALHGFNARIAIEYGFERTT